MKLKNTILLVASLITVAGLNLANAADSTKVKSKNVTTVMPTTVVDPNQCQVAPNIKAVLVFGNGGTGGWRESQCQTGYIPYGIKSYVGLGFSNGELNWQTYCCKAVVKYAS